MKDALRRMSAEQIEQLFVELPADHGWFSLVADIFNETVDDVEDDASVHTSAAVA